MFLENYPSFKKMFLKIVTFGFVIPLCVLTFFLYGLICINKEKIYSYSTSEQDKIKTDAKFLFKQILRSLDDISQSESLNIFLNSRFHEEEKNYENLLLFIQKEKIKLSLNSIVPSVAYCIKNEKSILIYEENLCKKLDKIRPFFEGNERVVYLEKENLFVFRSRIHNNKNLVVFSLLPFQSIKAAYPTLNSLRIKHPLSPNFELSAEFNLNQLYNRMIKLFYFYLIICSFITISSVLYGFSAAYKLKKNAENSEKLATIGRFAHILAHDIKKPFENIAYFSEQLEKCKNKNDAFELIETTKQLIQSSHKVIEKILNEFIHINDTSLQCKRIHSLMPLIHACLSTFQKNDLDKIKLNVSLSHKNIFHADRIKLERAFLNLISNAFDALKETHSNDKKFSIESFDQGKNIRIVFSNSGKKISKSERAKIFTPFYTTKKMGTGLGLPIAKKLIELHKGKIFCRSTENEIQFILDIPAKQKPIRRLFYKNSELRVNKKFIFLLDDCPFTLRAWKAHLMRTKKHFRINTFSNLHEFFHHIKSQNIKEKNIAAIICDYSFKDQKIQILDGLKYIRKFYSKSIYIATHMNEDIVKSHLKGLRYVLIDKNLSKLPEIN